jgi:hypothetical protein
MESADQQPGPAAAGITAQQSNGAASSRGARVPVWLNWTLALLTAPAAVVIVLIGMGAVMSLAACADVPCREHGPTGFWFGVAFYGAPVVAVLTIVVSFFTARHPRGILVPVCAWILLAADVGVLALFFWH